MANIMQMFRAKNKVTRDAYDLSKKLCFTAQPGELLPIYSRYVMPGDTFNDIDIKWKTRTAPVNSAAFTRFREYYDWYFVPMNLMWDKFNTWFTNMKDNNQVATSIKGTTNLTDKHPYLTFNNIRSHINGLKVAVENNASSSFIHKAAKNQFGFERWKLSAKLLHYLGYGDFYSPAESTNLYNLEMSPWRILAYQKIYQDWYRNTQWEAASPQTFNINYLSGAESDLNIPIDEYVVQEDTMFDLRYANWNKDLFMGVLPNSQFGDAASVNMAFDNSLAIVNDGLVSGNVNSNAGILSIGDNPLWHLKKQDGVTNYVQQFAILALRQAEALQKWKEITQSNSQDFPSQVDAHFGVRPNNAYSQRCIRLGGIDGTIEIQDVDNTNITENEDGSFNGADIAGKGLTFGSGKIGQFKPEVPGILMCIYHCVPLLDYALANVAMDNLKTLYTDYPIPEFDKTGMMQVPLAALTNNKNDLSSIANQIDAGNGLLGYAPNYIDAKTDIDEVKGAFYNGGLGSWVAPIRSNYIGQWWWKTNAGETWRGLDYRFFKVNPSVCNPIFATDASGDVSSDKIWINCYFDIKAVRPLDAQGLPY